MASRLAELWQLDPAITFLNHGSFGAAPRPVLAEQQQWRDLLERNPVRFFQEEYRPALDASRAALAAFVGADPAGLAFVPNATTGVNAVLRSLEPRLLPGDEIVVTNHAYNACRNAAEVAAGHSGAAVVVADVPFPLASADEVLDPVLAVVTARTRLVMIDHVTSPTGLVWPVDRIVAALEPDVPVLVDAAHAPGMVPMALDRTGAAFTAGNCHKWLCAPKGAGFLHVRADLRDGIVPVTVSHGWNRRPAGRSRFHALFDWTGTDEPSARLSVGAAIALVGGLASGGWPDVMAANRQLALAARDLLADALGVPPPAPDDMIGSMAALPLPDGSGQVSDDGLDPLVGVLRERWGIEVPVSSWPGPPRRLVRVSAQLYNDIGQYERLAAALAAEL